MSPNLAPVRPSEGHASATGEPNESTTRVPLDTAYHDQQQQHRGLSMCASVLRGMLTGSPLCEQHQGNHTIALVLCPVGLLREQIGMYAWKVRCTLPGVTGPVAETKIVRTARCDWASGFARCRQG